MSSASLNTIGLILDIIGALGLWRFGLPQTVNRGGTQPIITEQIDEADAVKARKYDQLSILALIFLVTGFILQVLSNYIQR